MTGLVHLRTLAQADAPADDGLLGNARCAWGGGDLVGTEAILAAFAAHPVDLEGDLVSVETLQSAALISESGALVADLYAGRIGRLWRVGPGGEPPAEPAIDIAFDPDMRQERGDLSFRAEDHPGLDPTIAERLVSAGRELIEQLRREGKLRVRGFVVRAFGDRQASAALLSLYTLSNETPRSAAFSYAVVGIGPDGQVRIVHDLAEPRDWTPRF